MKTKNIFKVLAVAMLMPAMLLTTACSNDDDAINNGDNKKGYPLQVTVNVTRQGDEGTTRATYTYDEGTKKGTLAFSAGDKLFVEGQNNTAGSFKGVLTWVSGGTFSGSINTKNEYTGTADALLTGASYVTATLLPAGYESYAFLSIEDETDCSGWIGMDLSKAFAPTKKAAVEQFSYERATSYSSGFALSPDNAIVSFTISGLAANTEVAVLFKESYDTGATPVNVTTDASGVATFAVAVESDHYIDDNTLTVDGIDITLPATEAKKGHIYNISRSVAPAPAATSLSELKTAINGGTDCSSYIGWEVNSAGAIAESGISGTKIGYVAYVSTSDVDADVSGSRILVIASADAAANTTWGSQGTARGVEAVKNANDLNGYSNTNTLQGYGEEAHPAAYAAWNYSATIPSGGATPAHWFMPTKKQWENMRDAKGGTYGAMATAYGIDGNYWTSNEYLDEDYNECKNYAWRFVTNSDFSSSMKLNDHNVRSIFAY